MKKGKCYSAVNMGQRKERDLYETHYGLTEQFLDREYFCNRDFYEPCEGNGAIKKVLQKRFYNVFGNDIKFGEDFLLNDFSCKYDNIITNPPFSYAFEFILICKRIVKNKFAMLLPLNYLHGKKRHDYIYENQDYTLENLVYREVTKRKKQDDGTFIKVTGVIPEYDLIKCKEFKIESIYVFTRYPMLGTPIREDGKYPTGMQVYAWYVWNSSYTGDPKIKWIDNNQYVIGKNDV